LVKKTLTNALGELLKVYLEIRCEHGWTYWLGILGLFVAHKGDKECELILAWKNKI